MIDQTKAYKFIRIGRKTIKNRSISMSTNESNVYVKNVLELNGECGIISTFKLNKRMKNEN